MNCDEKRALRILLDEYAPADQKGYFETSFREYLKVAHKLNVFKELNIYPKPEIIVEDYINWLKEEQGVTLFKKALYQSQPQS